MFLVRFLGIFWIIISASWSVELTFNQAVHRFLIHNNDLKIAHYEIDKAKTDLLVAQRRPNPIVYSSYSFLDVKHRFGDQAKGSPAFAVVHLDHPIELGEKRDARIKMAYETINYTQLLVAENQRQALITLLNAYYQVQVDQAHYHNALKNRQDFERLLTIAHGKFSRKLIDDVDVKELQLQWMNYNEEVQTAHSTLLVDTQTLALMLSLEANDIQLPHVSFDHQPMESTLDSLIDYAKMHRTDCLAAIQNVIVTRRSVDLEKANSIPDITLGIESEQYAPNYDNPLLGVSVAIPVPIYNTHQGEIERAKIVALQAHTQQSKILSQAVSEVRQAFLLYQSQQKVYASSQEEFNAIDHLKTTHLNLFEYKELSVLDLLDNLRRHNDYQQNLIKASVNVTIAYEYLKLSAGITPVTPKE